jgi:hypothetical protein
MNTIQGKKLLAVLALCALGLSAIAAVPSSDVTVQALYNEKWVAGAVTGSRAGAFAYYSINYLGDRSVVTIELRFAPADAVTKSGFGFNVYGPYAFFIGQGMSMGDEGGDGVLQLQYADDNPATWLVQVYNYLPNQTVAYGIVAKGLRVPQPTQPAPAPVRQIGPPVPLIGAGYLMGRPGGTFTFYNVTVVAGAPDVQLIMTCWPDDANIALNVGLVAYGPLGEVYRGTTTGIVGERKATLPATAPGVYRVQVYNYINGLTIQYMLRAGLAGQ